MPVQIDGWGYVVPIEENDASSVAHSQAPSVFVVAEEMRMALRRDFSKLSPRQEFEPKVISPLASLSTSRTAQWYGASNRMATLRLPSTPWSSNSTTAKGAPVMPFRWLAKLM